jgi:hypothetical protein
LSIFIFFYFYVFIYFVSIFFLKKIIVFKICFIMKIIFKKNCIFVWLDACPPVFPKDFFNRNGTSPGPPQRLPWSPCPVCHHRQGTGSTGNGPVKRSRWWCFSLWLVLQQKHRKCFCSRTYCHRQKDRLNELIY